MQFRFVLALTPLIDVPDSLGENIFSKLFDTIAGCFDMNFIS